MQIDIPIIKELMSLVKQNSVRPSDSWSKIVKYTVIVAVKVLGFIASLAGLAWVISYF